MRAKIVFYNKAGSIDPGLVNLCLYQHKFSIVSNKVLGQKFVYFHSCPVKAKLYKKNCPSSFPIVSLNPPILGV